MKREILRLFTITALVTTLSFFVAGCAEKEVQPPDAGVDTATVESAEPTEPEEAQEPADTGVEESDLGTAKGPEEPLVSEPAEDDQMAASQDTDMKNDRTSAGMMAVYFDFDRSTIRQDQVPHMQTNADFMNSNSDIRVRIEGNCDERGTNEYNMALGERRAMAAKKYLINLGINAGRLDTISYGEERPVVRGHDEMSWAINRRDDFVAIK